MNISGANILETPLGNLSVDHDVRRNLLATGLFDIMNSEVDSDEHSLEMQVCIDVSSLIMNSIHLLRT